MQTQAVESDLFCHYFLDLEIGFTYSVCQYTKVNLYSSER